MIETRVGLQAALNGDRTKAEDAELLAASGLVDRLTRILDAPGELQLLNSEDKASGAKDLKTDGSFLGKVHPFRERL